MLNEYRSSETVPREALQVQSIYSEVVEFAN